MSTSDVRHDDPGRRVGARRGRHPQLRRAAVRGDAHAARSCGSACRRVARSPSSARARALAAAQARPFVTPDDVRIVAPAVMGHRMLLTPEAELGKVDAGELVDQVLDQVELPAAMRQRA